MIKFVALLTMLVDHIGIVLFPQAYLFRIIGRVSMPLFAYCIARGFYYSRQHGSTKKYILYMLALALISQYPYVLMVGDGMNIGFTWLFSILLLSAFTSETIHYNKIIGTAAMGALLVLTEFVPILPVDYGFYGVILPLLFYILIQRKKENALTYVLVLTIGWAIYTFVNKGSSGSMAQLLSVAGAFVLASCKKHDHEVYLPKWVYYAFYPVHMLVLVLIRYL